jgi:lipopolysaccharide export system protein LptC
MTQKHLVQGVLALMACCLLVWQLLPKDVTENRPDQAFHTPDWFSVDAVVTDMDENGIPKRRFTAEKVLHYPNNKTSDMLRPTFTLFHPEREPWHLSSDKGRSFHGRHTSDIIRLDLWHDVVLQQIEADATTEMHTSTIAIFPNEDFAETDQSVLFLQPGQMLTGVGMRAYFVDNALELFSQVRSEHAPADKS